MLKKLVCLVLAVVLAGVFTGCMEEDLPTKETGAASSASTQAKKETFGLNDTAVFSALKFTANELKESGGAEYFTPESGNTFVGVKFTIENISDEDQAVSSVLLFDGYADDVKCDYSVNASFAFDDGTLDGTLAPGKKLVGWYSLEVPKNWSKIDLAVSSSWLSGSSADFVFTK